MAKKIFLYNNNGVTENYVLVDDDDFEWLNKWKWYLMKLYHCDSPILYARRYEFSNHPRKVTAILMHRFILGLTERSKKCDHRDGNGLNNQRGNLRESSHAENMSNRKRTKSESGYIGVSFVKRTGKWRASVRHNGKITQSTQETREGAALKYNEIALSLKGEFAAQNIV